ncbi:MAG: MFS transporter [Gammaproteobacteria bacterium]
MRAGDAALLGIVASDFFGALAGSTIHLTMVWWVLSQGLSDAAVSLMVLCIFAPLNVGVLLTGPAVARFGSRRLLVVSKSIALLGAASCFAALASGRMTPGLLSLIAIVTYGAMAPSMAADLARVPALARLAHRRLASFHAANSAAFVVGQLCGFGLAGLLAGRDSSALAVAIGVVLVAISLVFTWATFPTDRTHRRSRDGAVHLLRVQTRAVLARLRGTSVDVTHVFAAALIISTAQGCIEVALPLAIRLAGLPTSVLSAALTVAVVSGVVATLLAQAMQPRVVLGSSLMAIAVGLLLALLLAHVMPVISGVFIAVAATAAAASAAGVLTVTSVQQSVPTALQAQAIGLWQFLILGVGLLTIIATGQIGRFAFSLYALLSVAGIALAWYAQRRAAVTFIPQTSDSRHS